MINVGVIGVGYWGPNIIRNFFAHANSKVVSCCDVRKQRLDYINGLYPTIETTTDCNTITNDSKIDLLAVCTPVFSHYEIAKASLEAGKHVLIEKPMTYTSKQAEELVNIAEKKNLKIFVDHTFIYTGAVRKIKEVLTRDEIGDIYYFDSVRINLGLFQHDVNVVWDLAPHDISIMHYLINKQPEYIIATGADHFGSNLEDVAYLTIYYPNNIIAHIHTNWLSPVKIRKTLIAGSKKMIVWDDNEPIEKVKIYDKGVDIVQSSDEVYNLLIQYRTGDMYCPKIDTTEALTVEVNQIVDSLENDKTAAVDGKTGLMVVNILEAAQKSIKNGGKEVRI